MQMQSLNFLPNIIPPSQLYKTTVATGPWYDPAKMESRTEPAKAPPPEGMGKLVDVTA